MKYIKFMMMALMMCFVNYSYSQIYSGVITLDSTYTKSILYSNGLSFFANTFKSSNDVIQMKDSESGKIIGKGIADNRDVKITISCKDGKYKYDIEIEPIRKYTFTFDIKYFGTSERIWGTKWAVPGGFGEGVSKMDLLNIDVDNKNSSLIVNKNLVYFEFTNSHPAYKGYRVYYNDKLKAGWGLMENDFNQWKAMIDQEFIKHNNFTDITKPSDKVAEGLVEILKSEMSKLDW